MKQVPVGLTNELYLSDDHRGADLVTLELAAGTQRWTSGAVAISFGGNTWTPAPIVSQPRARLALGLEVGSLDLDVAADGITVAGAPLRRLAVRRELHGARLLVQRAFVDRAGAVAGLETIFDGVVVDVEPGVPRIRITAKDATARLDTVIPSRLVQPGCPYQVYGPECGVAPAGFTATTTCAAGSTTTSVRLSAGTALLTVSGWLEFTSGALAGRRAVVVEVISTAEARVAPPLPSAPVAGDGVKVLRGCDKRRSTCDTIFANKARFGGYPDAPAEETTHG